MNSSFGIFEPGYGLIDCHADPTSAAITDGHAMSSKRVPFADQTKYARWTLYYLLMCMFLAGAHNTLTTLSDNSYRTSGLAMHFPGKSWFTALFRFVGYQPLPLAASNVLGLPSTLGKMIFLSATLVYLLGITLIPKFWYRACTAFGSPPMAIRAGLISNALTPFILSFAGKVNVITLVTGISYEKLNIYHRATGWFAVLFAWIHTLAFLLPFVWEGGFALMSKNFNSRVQYKNGTVALGLLMVLCVVSLRVIRKKFYEFFLAFHWPIAIGYIFVLLWHDTNTLESWAYLWATIACYGAGLAYRYVVKTNFIRVRGDWFVPDTAVLKALPDNATEIIIHSKRVHNWTPSQHTYVRFTNVQPLGNHPFTIATVPRQDPSGYTKLRMVARAYDGMTKMLHDEALAKREVEYKVLLDGPYGGLDRDITSFDTANLICSGSGATAVLPLLNYLAEVSKSGRYSCTQSVNVLWIIRNRDAFEWFSKDLSEALDTMPKEISVRVQVCVTGESEVELQEVRPQPSPKTAPNNVTVESSGLLVSDSSDQPHPQIQFRGGRPDIAALLNEWSAEFGPRTVVVSAGGPSVSKAVTKATAQLQRLVIQGKLNKADQRYEEVYLFSEHFDW